MRTFGVLFILCVCLLFPSQAEAGGRRHKRSDASSKQKQENRAADKYGLSRIKDRKELEKFIAMGRLVLVTNAGSYYLDENPRDGIGHLDPDHKQLYHHARSWVKLFLDKELAEGHRLTGDRFKIAGLVRTHDYQKKLRQRNKGAIFGKVWWKQSLHLTGSAVDISFEGLSAHGMKWLRQRLKKLQAQGKIIAVKEFGHFHLMILPLYK
mgnify:CR=1 FL=1